LMYKPATFEINFASALPPPRGTSAVAVCVFADEPQLACASADEHLRRVCASILSAGEFKGEEDTTLLCRVADDEGRALRLLLVGLGAHADFTPAVLRRAAGAGLRQAQPARIEQLRFVLPAAGDAASLARA